MRKTALAAAAAGLVLALIAIPTITTSAAEVTPVLLRDPLAGGLEAEYGGSEGWAGVNSAALTAQGYSPASVGAAAASLNPYVTTAGQQTADGSVSVGSCCADLSVGSVLVDAEGQEKLSATDGDFRLAADWSAPTVPSTVPPASSTARLVPLKIDLDGDKVKETEHESFWFNGSAYEANTIGWANGETVEGMVYGPAFPNGSAITSKKAALVTDTASIYYTKDSAGKANAVLAQMTFSLPSDAPLGEYTLVLWGSQSGSLTHTFTVDLFSADDVFDLLPWMSFSFYLLDHGATVPPVQASCRGSGTGTIYGLGHYAMNLRTGALKMDDSRSSARADAALTALHTGTVNGQTVDSRFQYYSNAPSQLDTAMQNATNSRMLKTAFPQATILWSTQAQESISDAYRGQLADIADTVEWEFPAVTVPFSVGYGLKGQNGQGAGLGNSDTASFSLTDVLDESWLDGLDGSTASDVVVALAADAWAEWEKAFPADTLGALASTGVEAALQRAYGSGLNVKDLGDAVTAANKASLKAALLPVAQALLEEINTQIQGFTFWREDPSDDKLSCAGSKYPVDGVFLFDKVVGETDFSAACIEGSKTRCEGRKVMYPGLDEKVAQIMVDKLVARFDKSGSARNGVWQSYIEQNLTGTADLETSFTQAKIKDIVPTDVTATTKLTSDPVRVRAGSETQLAMAAEPELPSGTTVTSYTYSVADPSVATVDATGLVKGLREGQTTVTVSAALSCAGAPAHTLTSEPVVVTVANTVGGFLAVSAPLPQTALPVGTGLANQFALQVTIHDAGGAAAPGKTVSFTVNGGGGQPSLVNSSCVTNSFGTCTVSLRSTKSGTFKVQGTVDGLPLDNSVSLTWHAGTPVQLRSALTVAPAQVAAGEAATVALSLRDTYDNPVTGLGPGAVELTLPAGLTAGDVAETEPGVYTAAVSAVQAGPYSLSAKASGVTLPASTLTVTSAAASQAQLAVAPQAAGAGAEIVATATATDEHGNTVKGLPAADFDFDPDGLTVVSGPAPAGDGYAWRLKGEQALGDHVVAVTVAGATAQATVNLVPGVPAVADVTVAGSPAPVSPGAPATLTVRVTDAYDHVISDLRPSDFQWAFTRLKAGAPEAATAVAVDSFAANPDGTYSWTAGSATAGDFTGTVTVANAVSGSGDVKFTPGAAVASTLEFSPAPGRVNQPVTATYRPTDAAGNVVLIADPAQGLKTAFTTTPAGLSVGDWAVAADDYGQPTGYTAQVTGAAPGTFTGRVTRSGTPLATATLTLEQYVDTVTLALSPAAAQVSAAAGATVTATVTVQGDGSPYRGLANGDITLGATSGGAASTAVSHLAWKETAAGTYQAKIHSEQAGTFALVAAAGGQTSDGATVEFTPEAPNAAQSTWTAPATVGLPPNGSDGEAKLTYQLKDRYGNPVPGRGDAFTVTTKSDGSGTVTLEGPAEEAPGVYVWRLKTSTAGRYTATASFTGLAAKAATVNFDGIWPSKANSGLVADPASGPTGLAADSAVWATVTVKDSADSPITGLTGADFELVSSPAGVNLDAASATNVGPGEYKVKLWSTQVGTFKVWVKVIGSELDDADDQVEVTFDAVPRQAAGVVVADQAQANGAAQDVVEVTVTDGFGNPVPGVQLASASADLNGLAIAETDDQGKTRAGFTSTRPGTYQAQVTHDQLVVTGSPFSLVFGTACLPGVDEGCDAVDGKAGPHLVVTSDHAYADGTEVNKVRVVVADQQGNPVPAAQLRASLDGGTPVAHAADGDGEWEFAFASDKPGRLPVVVEVYSTGQWRPVTVAAAQPPAGWVSSPAQVNYDIPADQQLSIGTVPTPPQPATGVFTLTAQAVDRVGQPRSGVAFAFAVDLATATLSTDACTTGDDGTCQVTVTSPVEGLAHVTATAESAQLTAVVMWSQAPDPSPDPVVTAPAHWASLNDGAVEVSGTGVAGSAVVVSEGTAELCAETVAADGNWSCHLSPALADGEHTLSVVQSSAQTLPSNAVQRVVVIDTAAPAAPVIDQPEEGATGAPVRPAFAGTAEANAIVTVQAASGGPLAPAGDLCQGQADRDGNWSCASAEDLPTGLATVVATAADAAQNVSAPTTRSFTVGSTPVVLSPTAGGTVQTTTPTISGGQAAAGAEVTVTEAGTTLCQGTADGSGAWSCTVGTALSAGDHTVSAHQTVGGVAGPAGASVTFTVSPQLELTVTNSRGNQVIASGKARFRGIVTVGATVTVKEGETTLCTVTATTTSWVCVTDQDLADGHHEVTVTATTSAASATRQATVEIDLVPPAAPVITGPDPSDRLRQQPVVVTGTAEPGSTVTVRANSQQACTDLAVTAAGEWSCSLAGLAEGSLRVEASAADAMDNESTAAAAEYWVNLLPPARVTFTDPNPPQVNFPDTVTFGGVGEAGATVALTATPNDPGTGQTLTCSSPVAPDGKWSCEIDSAELVPSPLLLDYFFTAAAVQTDGDGQASVEELMDFSLHKRGAFCESTAPTTRDDLAQALADIASGLDETLAGAGDARSQEDMLIAAESLLMITDDWQAQPLTP
ncbi:MAG: Ig-like domain-containing protein, partial [Propionibacteriaceae bacterium]|nr:Ig-like domain-containing protein [Propionibacteriaceae bacterium]